ncbi:MAG: ComEC/Rec2 family competence protein [Paludibacteraceae bacterium]
MNCKRRFSKSYSATGAMHILSVSGLHVGIVYAVIAFLLRFLDKKRRTKIFKAVIIILFLWIYAFITGLSPAVMRAAFMFSFVSLATCFERKSQIYNTIFASAFLMLLIQPNSLFNIGFQLSYAAVLSIVFFQPGISKWIFPRNKIAKWTWDLVAVSVAAQLGTAPFTLYYFHQFPNFFLLTNIIAIPLSSIIIYLAIALLLLSFVPLLSTFIALLLKWSLWLMNSSIVFIQELPFSVSYLSLDYRQLIFSFVALFFVVFFFYNKKFSLLIVGLCSILVVTSIFFYQKYTNLRTAQFIVFSDSRVPIINFIFQEENYVFTTDSLHAEKIADSFWKSKMLNNPTYLNKNQWFESGFCCFYGKRIFILTDNTLKNKTTENPLPIDYLVITNKTKPKIEHILACMQPKTVIVDKCISAWYTNHIKEVCRQNKTAFYIVAENGAFVLNLNP